MSSTSARNNDLKMIKVSDTYYLQKLILDLCMYLVVVTYITDVSDVVCSCSKIK